MPTQLPTSRNPLLQSHWTVLLAVLFAGVAMVLRFAPLPENFACFGSLALFSGIALRGPARWFVPMLSVFAADCTGQFLGLAGMGFYDAQTMALNYLGFAAFIAIGQIASRFVSLGRPISTVSVGTVFGSAFLGSLSFFLISNFGAWLDPQMSYERSVRGLMTCYSMGLPFWQSSLTSDIVFSGLFCGVGAAVAMWVGAGKRAAA